jgi:hypothetical protein
MTYILNQKVDTMLDAGTVRNHKSPGNFFQGISRHPCGISCLLHSHYDPQQLPSIPLRKTARFCVHEATRGVSPL